MRHPDDFDRDIIPAPEEPGQWPAFREALLRWREEKRPGYDDALYRQAEFAWAPSCFSCCFVMVCDALFLDPERGVFTPDAFLAHGEREFGGYDGAVLWHAYPRIGLDDRNQFDFYRDLPGGLEGVRTLSRALRARGVKVFIDYNPWDTGTRREDTEDIDALVELVRAVEADGIFLDTMDRGAAEFRGKLDAVRPGVVLEGEVALPLENIHDHHMSWAQWFRDSRVPGVLRNKWFEPRHMLHGIDRWNRDHTAEIHTAWMNGSGMMVWENVFGSWVGWSARDRSLLRAMLPIQRRYVGLFTGESWTPLVPTQMPNVYASLWEGESLRLWTLVNRSDAAVEGTLLAVEPTPGARAFDLIRGGEAEAVEQTGVLALCGALPPRGIGAFVVGRDSALGSDFGEFLGGQAEEAGRASFDTRFPAREAVLKRVTPTRAYPEAPPGMAAVPAATMTLKTTFRVRECGFYEPQHEHLNGFGFHALHGPITFERSVSLTAYAIDVTPVTNGQFARFRQETGYRPRHEENFLKHWQGGAPPPGKEEHPVVYVGLDDARAYARWAGARLPTEEEWQYAAAGPGARRFPWGDEDEPHRRNGGEHRDTTPVTAYPEGRSPFGCLDMCGNVWEWTESERSDGRTRFSILRGGSYYRAEGSHWYMDGGPRATDFATKFLLAWPGLDRCATIGFRCAVDLA